MRAILTTDGGGDGVSRGAAAGILSLAGSSPHLKVVAFLGAATGNEAELCGALLGCCLAGLANEDFGDVEIHWETDSQYLLRTSAQVEERGAAEGFPNAGFWKAYLSWRPDSLRTREHVFAHSGHRRNERCDSACRWIQRKGELLLATHGEGRIGRNAITTPANAWVLIDWRQVIARCREPAQEAENYRLLMQSVRDILHP